MATALWGPPRQPVVQVGRGREEGRISGPQTSQREGLPCAWVPQAGPAGTISLGSWWLLLTSHQFASGLCFSRGTEGAWQGAWCGGEGQVAVTASEVTHIGARRTHGQLMLAFCLTHGDTRTREDQNTQGVHPGPPHPTSQPGRWHRSSCCSRDVRGGIRSFSQVRGLDHGLDPGSWEGVSLEVEARVLTSLQTEDLVSKVGSTEPPCWESRLPGTPRPSESIHT